MAIDLTSETIISPTDAVKRLPARRAGKRPHVSCIYRWMAQGCRGIVLESIQVGSTRCTSVEALQRFFQRLGEGTPAAQAIVGRRSKSADRRDRDDARYCEAVGL